ASSADVGAGAGHGGYDAGGRDLAAGDHPARRAAQSRMSVEADLGAYEALLRKWNAVQNLVSRETLHELRPRHIDDSLQLLPLLRPSDRRIIDLGSGGGFPAIPLAIASRGLERRFTLVEPIAKKASFLRTVARELA